MIKLSNFDFALPKSLIAQNPLNNRTDSRLLVLKSTIIDTQFSKIADFLQPNDLLVMNDTCVIPARLFAHKKSGGKAEIMIERMLSGNKATAMIRSNKTPKIGSELVLENFDTATILNKNEQFYTLKFSSHSLPELLNKIGHIPLPPYISRADNKSDLSRYQTIYAAKDGAVAAPTAGLHFDAKLLSALKNRGINHAFVTLHIGAGTFLPVRVDNIETHTMHSEHFTISQQTVDEINRSKANGGRIIAVGTTSVRVLESAAKDGVLKADCGDTDIFIYPGFKFKAVDAMITNFHLPKSSLLMLVSAFIGHQQMLAVYQHAITQKYRFFSYGDAMLLDKNQT